MNPQISSVLEPFLIESRTLHGGSNLVFQFGNKFGASVVRHKYSYGGNEGLWELAVLDSDLKITYDTPITQDVLGWLDWEKVLDTLYAISKL